mmetsp:Transcript_9163/g.30171  ORF Transcript_9163/g.30171 Transcript_9163/m.30171 type:complete len:258 (+) Transcript_9163:77-850(+)
MSVICGTCARARLWRRWLCRPRATRASLSIFFFRRMLGMCSSSPHTAGMMSGGSSLLHCKRCVRTSHQRAQPRFLSMPLPSVSTSAPLSRLPTSRSSKKPSLRQRLLCCAATLPKCARCDGVGAFGRSRFGHATALQRAKRSTSRSGSGGSRARRRLCGRCSSTASTPTRTASSKRRRLRKRSRAPAKNLSPGASSRCSTPTAMSSSQRRSFARGFERRSQTRVSCIRLREEEEDARRGGSRWVRVLSTGLRLRAWT